MAVTMKIAVFWNMMTRSLVDVYRRFGGMYFLPIQERKLLTTLCHIVGDIHLHSHQGENFESQIIS
jgi:hypothetical protein